MNNETFENYMDRIDSMRDDASNGDAVESLIYECSKFILNNSELAEPTEKITKFTQLSSMARWAQFEDDYRAVEIAQNIIDRAIEIAVSTKSEIALNELLDELENNLELDDRADEVREIIANL
jgi:hypothetical protein